MFEGLRRAWEVTRESYREDRQRPKTRRKRQELEFMPAAVEVLETPPSPAGRIVALVIAAFVVGTLAWAWFGRIDTVAVAQGQIIAGEGIKVIQPLEIGTVNEIHVEEGEHIEEGAPLIELDPTVAGADRAQLRHSLIAARFDAARAEALLANRDAPLEAFHPPAGADLSLLARARALLAAEAKEIGEGIAALDGEIVQRRAERATIQARVHRYDDTIPLLQQRVDAFAYLVKKEYGRRLTLLELQEQLVTQQRERTVEKRRRAEADAAIRVLQRQRAERLATVQRTLRDRLAEATDEAYRLEQELKKAEERRRLRVLRAPVSGTVEQLAVHTEGAVVTPAEQLMVIVPDGSTLEIEAMVLNRDVGFVHEQQPVAIKVESFPFTKYGLIPGRVEHVSAGAVADERLGLVYPARISMGRDRILVGERWVKLGLGMAVTAEVKTGKRRAIEFFLSPFLEYQDEALRER